MDEILDSEINTQKIKHNNICVFVAIIPLIAEILTFFFFHPYSNVYIPGFSGSIFLMVSLLIEKNVVWILFVCITFWFFKRKRNLSISLNLVVFILLGGFVSSILSIFMSFVPAENISWLVPLVFADFKMNLIMHFSCGFIFGTKVSTLMGLLYLVVRK